MTIDFTDELEELNELERDFVELTVTGSIKTLDKADLQVKFGDQLAMLENNLDLRRVIANQKISIGKHKFLSKKFQSAKIVELMPYAISVMVDLLQNGNETTKKTILLRILDSNFNYLEMLGKLKAAEDAGIDIKDQQIRIDAQDAKL